MCNSIYLVRKKLKLFKSRNNHNCNNRNYNQIKTRLDTKIKRKQRVLEAIYQNKKDEEENWKKASIFKLCQDENSLKFFK